MMRLSFLKFGDNLAGMRFILSIINGETVCAATFYSRALRAAATGA